MTDNPDETAHPYSYINEKNFEIIQTCFKMGLSGNKQPHDIANMLKNATDLPDDVCKALVQLELLPTMQKLRTMTINKNMPEGSEFKHDV
jgi:hypothetical protein